MKYFLKEYSWFNDLLYQMSNLQRLTIQHVILIGGRFSGKSTAVQVFCALAALLKEVKVGIVFLRASKDGGKDLYEDIESVFETFDFPYKGVKSNGMFLLGKTKIRVIGLNSMSNYGAKKSGLPRFHDVDYIIKIYEEAFEFNEREYKAVQEAIRHVGDKIPSHLTIRICNPWSRENWVIKEAIDYMPQDKNILEQKGSQHGIFTYHDKETGFTNKILIQYTNWRVAKEFLTQEQILQIKQYWETDRNRAIVADLGMAGFEFGAIYSGFLHKIAEPFYTQDPCYLMAGMDYGWSQVEGSGKTAVVFCTGSQNNGVDIFNEFVWDNSKHPIEPNNLCERVVLWLKEQVQEWMINLNWIYPPKLVCRVDNSEQGIIALLNNVATKYGLNNWLSFTSCKKYPTQDRIAVTLALLGTGKFRMNISRCKNLMSELEFSHYEEKGEKKRIKLNDHSLNAFEYAIEPLQYKWPSALGMDMKNFKRRLE